MNFKGLGLGLKGLGWVMLGWGCIMGCSDVFGRLERGLGGLGWVLGNWRWILDGLNGLGGTRDCV